MPGLGLGIGRNKSSGVALGPELATGWNTAAFWSTVGPGWTFNEGVDMTCDGTTGSMVKNSFWGIGKIYQIEITVEHVQYNLRPPYDGGGTYEVISSSKTIIYEGSPAGVAMYMYSQSFAGTITALSIKELL